MKSAQCVAYCDPRNTVRLSDVERPVPAADDVLVRIRAASVNVSDLVTLLGRPYATRLIAGWTKPKDTRPGRDFSGVIEQVGQNVVGFKPGQAVLGVCRGACAEYACTPASRIALKPARLTFEEAASIPVAGLTALQGLRDIGQLKPGARVLVTGASSGVGTFAVQIAKALGGHVTAVCGRTSLTAVQSLGPDAVIDRDEEDYAARGERYDLVFDLAGDRSLGACRRLLTPTGRYVGAGVLAIQDSPIKVLSRFASLTARSRLGGQPLAMFVAKLDADDLATLADMAERGQVRPLIDRTYTLGQAGEAFAYLAARHAHGKVAISIA
jgi:NADPH:quinone reductase-like Zn-dependent oxidoreductase